MTGVVDAENDLDRAPAQRSGTPQPPVAGRRALVGVAGASVYGGYLAFLWFPLLAGLRTVGDLAGTIKDAYLGDQLSYLAIARNVQDGRSAYLEPFTASSHSVYPSGYYWLLGQVARVTHTNPFVAWNVVGLACSVLLAIVAGLWMRWATAARWTWVLGPIPLVIGTLGWFQRGSWLTHYGDHAVLWPGYMILFNPNGEVFGIVLLMATALCVARAWSATERQRWWALAAGVLLGLGLHVHTYTTMFAVTAVLAGLVVFRVLSGSGLRQAGWAGLSFALSFAVVLSGVVDSPLARLAIVLIGLAIPLLLPGSRPGDRALLMIMLGSAVATATPMFVRFVADLRGPDSFLVYRQAIAHGGRLSLPVPDVLLALAPVFLLGLAAAVALGRDRADEHARIWAALLIGCAVAGGLLTFNQAWGMNQEPYRFLPYWQLTLAVLAFPWLVRSGPRAGLVARAGVVLALVTTLPTNALWVRDHEQARVRFTAAERHAMARAVSHVPARGLAMTDTCVPRRALKVLTRVNIVDYNPGLALPARTGPVSQVVAEQREGMLPSGAELRAAGVTALVAMSACRTSDPDVLRSRFGPPVAAIQLRDAASCGMPPDLALLVYDTRNDASSAPVRLWTVGPTRFAPTAGGVPVVPSSKCAYGFEVLT